VLDAKPVGSQELVHVRLAAMQLSMAGIAAHPEGVIERIALVESRQALAGLGQQCFANVLSSSLKEQVANDADLWVGALLSILSPGIARLPTLDEPQQPLPFCAKISLQAPEEWAAIQSIAQKAGLPLRRRYRKKVGNVESQIIPVSE
jgi:hypothetical protein